MPVSRRAIVSIALLASIAMTAPIALAGSVTAEFDQMALGSSADQGNVYYNGVEGTGYVGAIQFTGISGNPAPFNATFDSYCMDLSHDVYISNTYTFTSEDFAAALASSSPQNNPNAANQIEDLYGSDLPGTNSVANDATTQAAFQLAIWNIIYNGPTSPTQIPTDGGGGNVFSLDHTWSDTAAVGLADNWLSNLTAGPSFAQLAGLASDGTSQGQVFFEGFTNLIGGAPSIPAAPVFFGALGLLGVSAAFGAVRRRRAVI